jgi:ZIP family zinc transporter
MATASERAPRVPNWVAWAGPLALVAVMVTAFLVFDPIAGLREVPPAEAVAVERTVFKEDLVELHVRNDGPDPVTIAQVLVDDAYWNYSISDSTLGRLESATIRIPYPWDEGLPFRVALLTSTGLRIEHEVEAAALTPELDAATLGVYALLGVYIGVLPIAIGLLWFPSLRRASRRWFVFFLAFTVGLLAFLLIDTVVEGLELAGETAAVLNGFGLFGIGALFAVTGLLALQGALASRTSAGTQRGRAAAALVLAYLIAAGIGLHNMGEGLAVGAALAAGEIALGTFLVVGFAVHNTTEGLAIVAPLGAGDRRPSLWHFAALGAVAGVPTIFGAWIGGFAFSPVWGALAFGIAAGAIAQVIVTILRGFSDEGGMASAAGAAGFSAGLLFMYGTGLLAA